MVNPLIIGGRASRSRPKPLAGGNLMQTLYVAPGASSVASGTLDDPISFTTALLPGSTQPGSTIYLRSGTYSGNFVGALSGKSGAKTTIRNYPGEDVVIDGSLTLNGNYLRLLGTS